MKNNELYQNVDNECIYEILHVSKNAAVLLKFPQETVKPIYAVVSKPYIINDMYISWRSCYNGYKSYSAALKKSEDINNMYNEKNTINIINYCGKQMDSCIAASMKEDFHYDLKSALEKLSEKCSKYEIALTCAVNTNDYDGRYSKENKEWAADFCRENGIDKESLKSKIVLCKTHPIIINGFTERLRANIANTPAEELNRISDKNELDLTQDTSIHR